MEDNRIARVAARDEFRRIAAVVREADVLGKKEVDGSLNALEKVPKDRVKRFERHGG